MSALNSLDNYPMRYEHQEDISELPETLKLLRQQREKLNLWRLKKSKGMTNE